MDNKSYYVIHFCINKFQVVEFLDGVQVVPIRWLSEDKKKCVFPVHVNNQNQYNKMVATMSSPKESWQSWDVLKVIGSSDNFEKANKKMSDAVQYNLSEVNTEYEDTQKTQRKSRARKKISSSSEDETNCNNTLIDDYPTPPMIQQIGKKLRSKKLKHSETSEISSNLVQIQKSKLIQDTVYRSFKNYGTFLNKSSHEDDPDMFSEAIVQTPNKLQNMFSTPTKSIQRSYSKENSKLIHDTVCGSFKNQGTSLNKSLHEDDPDMFSEAIVQTPNKLQNMFSTPTKSIQRSYSKENSKLIHDTVCGSFKNQGTSLNKSLHEDDPDMFSEAIVQTPNKLQNMFSTPTKSIQRSYSKENSKLIHDTVHGSFKNQGTSLNKSLHEDDPDMFSEAIVQTPNKLQNMFSTPTKSIQRSYSKEHSKLIHDTVHGSFKNQGTSLNKSSQKDNAEMFLEAIVNSPNELQVQNEFHPNSKFENKINSSSQKRKNNSTPSYSNEMFRSSQTEMNFECWMSKSLNHILRSNAHLKMQNCMILENQKEIIAHLTSIKSTDLFEPIPEQFSMQFSEYFPLPNKEKVMEVEEKLLNNDFKMNFIKRIKTFGGVDISHFIKSCLQKLFSTELSTQISFTGKAFKKCSSPKLALIKLKLFQIICDVGRTCYPNYTDDIVQKSVTGWLRHSTDRLQSLIQKQLENNMD
ncbi:uncharacterized protein LOC132935857 isoform X2 [Metopolophium dirhodum]|uniref:uncharacterized protein LOC132935857 isoform X2 n=1 Tax=Metopolophium dirhodum TaxID=44670 RepID=UPI00298F408D|nr:uncharacterized protein LOC132935857 isoform X2 [Metopolophium dirhodum]